MVGFFLYLFVLQPHVPILHFPFLSMHEFAVLCTFSHILFKTKSNSLPKFDLWVDLWWAILVSLSLLFDIAKLKKRQHSYSEISLSQRQKLLISHRIVFLAVLDFQTRKCFWLTVSEIRSTWNMCKFRISLICKSVSTVIDTLRSKIMARKHTIKLVSCCFTSFSYQDYLTPWSLYLIGKRRILWRSKLLGQTLWRRRKIFFLVDHTSDSSEGLSWFSPTSANTGFVIRIHLTM